MNPQDKIPFIKKAMPNDPVVDVLDALCKQTGTIAGKIVSLEEYGMTLRYTRVWAFFIMFVIGLMAGGTIVQSHYKKPDSLSPFRQAGVNVTIGDDGANLTLIMRGSTMKNVHAEYDGHGNKVGFLVVYGKEQQP